MVFQVLRALGQLVLLLDLHQVTSGLVELGLDIVVTLELVAQFLVFGLLSFLENSYFATESINSFLLLLFQLLRICYLTSQHEQFMFQVLLHLFLFRHFTLN